MTKEVHVDGRNSEALRAHIETLLHEHGDPVRWAIVSADIPNGTVCVEAVITKSS